MRWPGTVRRFPLLPCFLYAMAGVATSGDVTLAFRISSVSCVEIATRFPEHRYASVTCRLVAGGPDAAAGGPDAKSVGDGRAESLARFCSGGPGDGGLSDLGSRVAVVCVPAPRPGPPDGLHPPRTSPSAW